MPLEKPNRFRSAQDWNLFIETNASNLTLSELFELRLHCYKEIEALRDRPLLVYASRFLDAPAGLPNSIDLTDVEGFTDLVNSIPSSESVDVLLHSPGGSPDATERIVAILRNRFKQVHFLIPHSAYSAATMLALSGNSVTLHASATLGPIDPQLDGIPARSIKRGFEKAKEAIKSEGPDVLPAYIPLIEQYPLHLLEICDDSEKLSKELVTNWLFEYMLEGEEKFEAQIKNAVDYFSDYDTHLLHSRPLLFSKLSSFQLNISVASNPLAELMWEAFLHLNGMFKLSTFVKMFENTHGVGWGRNVQISNGPNDLSFKND